MKPAGMTIGHDVDGPGKVPLFSCLFIAFAALADMALFLPISTAILAGFRVPAGAERKGGERNA
jgi:hypothetical protein